MTDILSLYPEELEKIVTSAGFPKFRSAQLSKWLGKGVRDFDLMTDLPADFKQFLKTECSLYKPEIIRKQVSAVDGTIKYLWRLYDGNSVETVVMSYKHGNTVCISSQVGCRQGCAFCASTIGGLVRQLNPSEMLDEVWYSELDSGKHISNIVLMGIGEPLDNYDNVIRFLRLVNRPDRLNIGMRHISLSTCGLTERFEDLAAEDMQITLSVSLHAASNEKRNLLMPANKTRGVDNLINSCRKYYDATGRRISFEYAMIDGVNDSESDAELLAEKALAVKAHVNLIPLNYVEERKFKPSSQNDIKKFIAVLESKGVNVTVRRKLGGDIDASCGQLRRNEVRKTKG